MNKKSLKNNILSLEDRLKDIQRSMSKAKLNKKYELNLANNLKGYSCPNAQCHCRNNSSYHLEKAASYERTLKKLNDSKENCFNLITDYRKQLNRSHNSRKRKRSRYNKL